MHITGSSSEQDGKKNILYGPAATFLEKHGVSSKITDKVALTELGLDLDPKLKDLFKIAVVATAGIAVANALLPLPLDLETAIGVGGTGALAYAGYKKGIDANKP